MDLQFRRLKRLGDGASLIEVCVERGKDTMNPDVNHWIFMGTLLMPEELFLKLLDERKITRNIYITDALEFSKKGEVT